MLPILCGSFHHFVSNGHHPSDDACINAFIATLQRETAGKRVLAVASVDLAHVGPNFGDMFVMDARRRQALRRQDESLMAAVTSGDYARFYEEIATVQDRNRICGFSSTYLMLRYLAGEGEKRNPAIDGKILAYEQCPADSDGTSLVSICGLLLT